MQRRQFLKVIAFDAAAGWLSARGRGSASADARAVPWNALAGGLAGEVVLPENSRYETARRLYNPRYDAIRPAAIAFCENPFDVRECLAFARRSGVSVRARGGGHSYAGWSTGPGLVVDVSRMNQVTVNTAAKTASVGAGAVLIDVYDQLAKNGVTVPAGLCPTVGIAGSTLGGGIGVVSRAYGLTCDNVVAVNMVTADGKIRTANANSDPDLYWACRGGGGGNFGVATSFIFRTHPAEDITHVTLEWPWPEAARVLRSWQNWGPTAPDHVWSHYRFHTDPTGKTPGVNVLIVSLGSQRDLEPLLDKLIGATGSESSRRIETQSHLRAMLALAGCTSWRVDECRLPSDAPRGNLQRDAFAAKSDFFSQPLSSNASAAVIHYAEQGHATRGLVHGSITFDAFGGAIGRVASHDTAFVHRGALFNAQYLAYWKDGGSGEAGENSLAWLRSFHRAMRPHANGGAYVNYIDPELVDWQQAYYGSNYKRLQRVKARYDPDWLFKLPQGISPH